LTSQPRPGRIAPLWRRQIPRSSDRQGAVPLSPDVSVLDPSRYPPLPPRLLANSRVVPDRIAALSLWPQDAVVVEVGVAFGQFSRQILERRRPSRFVAIDRFDLHTYPTLWGKPSAERFGGRTHLEYYQALFAEEIAAGRLTTLQGDSAAAIAGLPDASVDLFYVDADHTYDGVKLDIAAILPKVKPDGWIVMNDYVPAEVGWSNEPYGVIQATHELMLEHDWEMIYLALGRAMYCDVGLRRLDRPAEESATGSTSRATVLLPEGGRGLVLADQIRAVEAGVRARMAGGGLDGAAARSALAGLAAVRAELAAALAATEGPLPEAERARLAERLEAIEAGLAGPG
jgi:hypothetical protein